VAPPLTVPEIVGELIVEVFIVEELITKLPKVPPVMDGELIVGEV
jgi:hypothetical protein